MGTNIRTIYRTNTKRSSKQLKRRRVRARKVYGLPTFACRAQNNADRTQTMGGRERTYHQVARMSALRTSTTAQASPRSQRRRVFSNRVGAQRATFINLTAMETDECARVYLEWTRLELCCTLLASGRCRLGTIHRLCSSLYMKPSLVLCPGGGRNFNERRRK